MTSTSFIRPCDMWAQYTHRYCRGEWRSPIFRDMILDDARQMGKGLTFLDIGCGGGFDADAGLQQSLVDASGQYIGIEPDETISLGQHIKEAYRCIFEESLIPNSSVDIAFSVMVLEHLPNPKHFFRRLWEVLREGGVFWGFTMDARHPFCVVSQWMKHLHLKDAYLSWLLGRRGSERYNNYPTHYLANSPRQIAKHCSSFSRCQFVSFSRVGQLDCYVPRWLRPVMHCADRATIAASWPGSLLAIRLEK